MTSETTISPEDVESVFLKLNASDRLKLQRFLRQKLHEYLKRDSLSTGTVVRLPFNKWLDQRTAVLGLIMLAPRLRELGRVGSEAARYAERLDTAYGLLVGDSKEVT